MLHVLTHSFPTGRPSDLSTALVGSRGQSFTAGRALPHSSLRSEAYLKSPGVRILRGEGGIRRRLEGANPPTDFPILEDLLAEGATDYVAMPMRFSNGKINILTLACDRRGGFTPRELGWIHEALPILSRLLAVQTLHPPRPSLPATNPQAG